jgi:hypothetical protein
MSELVTAKYLRTGVTRPSNHKEVTAPIITMSSDENFGDLGFTMYWETVTQPFVMANDTHKHDFPQYLTFLGGDPTNFLDLNGEVELALSVDGVNLERHTITTATNVYIPAGLYHSPLIFKRVDKPIIFIDCYFAKAYKRGAVEYK